MARKRAARTNKRDDAEDRASAGRDESWFANIKRTYDEFQQESLADIRAHRKHSNNVDAQLVRLLTNAVTADSERSERVNAHNMNATENMNYQNDAAFLLLAKALDDGDEVTYTVSKRKGKKA